LEKATQYRHKTLERKPSVYPNPQYRSRKLPVVIRIESEGAPPNQPDPSNAAPEWQAIGLVRPSRELMAACPLKGCVRSVASSQETSADLSCTSIAHATLAMSSTIPSFFTKVFNFRPKAEMTFEIV
jgi:hypothetical protein